MKGLAEREGFDFCLYPQPTMKPTHAKSSLCLCWFQAISELLLLSHPSHQSPVVLQKAVSVVSVRASTDTHVPQNRRADVVLPTFDVETLAPLARWGRGLYSSERRWGCSELGSELALERKVGRGCGSRSLRRFETVTHKRSAFENRVDRSRKLLSIGLQQIPGSKAECALYDFRRWLLTQENDL